MARAATTTDVFTAVAEARRRQILELLAQGERPVGELVAAMDLAQPIQIVREFAAPPAAVWRVWTEPELIRRWWAGRRGEVTLIEMDLRVGGAWRFVMQAGPGFEVAFHGVNEEIAVGERLVSTEVYEAVPDAEARNTATFEALPGGRCRLTILTEHQNTANRDMHVESGMEGGVQEGLDIVEQLAVSLG